MIKLTSHTGKEPIFINPGEIAFVWEGDAKEHDARANAILRLRPFSWEARGVLVKETPAEVAALIEEATNEALDESDEHGPIIVRAGEYPDLCEILRRTPGYVIYTPDGLKAIGTVKRKPGGRVLVGFTLTVAWDPTTAVFDGWGR